jgi:hypothetical protein
MLSTADNGRAIFRMIPLNQPMGDHLTHIAVTSVVEIDSNTAGHDGFNGTSTTEVTAVEDKIY